MHSCQHITDIISLLHLCTISRNHTGWVRAQFSRLLLPYGKDQEKISDTHSSLPYNTLDLSLLCASNWEALISLHALSLSRSIITRIPIVLSPHVLLDKTVHIFSSSPLFSPSLTSESFLSCLLEFVIHYYQSSYVFSLFLEHILYWLAPNEMLLFISFYSLLSF